MSVALAPLLVLGGAVVALPFGVLLGMALGKASMLPHLRRS
ncbi:hypothetical protein [Microvirga yunnanensis]|nr:hypothetical protein [Microvirga sp. HBU67655]